MFRKEYQKGFLSVFSSFGSAPLKIWDVKVENGCVDRIKDEDLKCLVVELIGDNVSTTYITCPKNKEETLGIAMPILTLNWKHLDEFFAFEIVVKDNKNLRRRFRFSNFLNIPRIKSAFSAVCPIKPNPGWLQLKFNLCDLTQKAFSSCYVETIRIQVNANCRLKGIYFSDTLYDEKDIPNEYRLVQEVERRKVYIPFQKKKKARKSSKQLPSPESEEAVPWIQGLKDVEEEFYDHPPNPSEATSEEDKQDTYILRSGETSEAEMGDSEVEDAFKSETEEEDEEEGFKIDVEGTDADEEEEEEEAEVKDTEENKEEAPE